MKFIGFKLFFNDLDTGYPVLHSDTLFSLIISALAELDKLPESIPDSDIKISSAFPFYQDYLFFPMPHDFSQEFTGILLPTPCYFISQPVLSAYFNETLSELAILQSGCFLAEDSHPLHFIYPLWITQNSPVLQSDKAYHQAYRFRDEAGLFFLAQGSDSDIADIKTALDFLTDEGIGRNRSIGRGTFSFEQFHFEFEKPSDTKHLLLSLYHPTENELDQIFCNVSDIRWKQRAFTPFFSSLREAKFMLMATEGSIFTAPTHNMGSVVKIFNENKKLETQTPIYRSGKALFL